MDAALGSLAVLEREVLPFFAPAVRRLLDAAARAMAALAQGRGAPPGRRGSPGGPDGAVWPWEEIRLRAGRPLLVAGAGGDAFVGADGLPVREPGRAYEASEEDVRRTLELMSGSSLYAVEAEMRQGFLTLPGGHRVGLCGRAVAGDGGVRALRDIASLNVRIARAVPGAADALLPLIMDRDGLPMNTLVFSSPGGGKTTILRDLTRQIAAGRPDLGWGGLTVAVADERLELSGYGPAGPALDLGPRSDVLAGCPKAWAMPVLVRAMAPRVLVTDELGRPEDAEAVADALRCGVRVLASAHAGSLEEIRRRPALRRLLAEGAFQRLVQLGRSRGPGTVEGVWDGSGAAVAPPRSSRSPVSPPDLRQAAEVLAAGGDHRC